MDRISTAPVPKSKKWLKNGSNSSLLRHPSGQVVVAPLIPVSARPHSRLAPKLTPQLHWNLNNSALKTLSNPQVEQLYGLFKFYESSTAGDELPSMNCARFLDILRDARLLDDSSSSEPTKELQVDSVERIFAQAVMGKMRAYLDADGQPALTFSQFCGALMNCAMLWSPSLHPEKALREFIPILMENSVDRGYQVAIGTGLISHIPVEGKLSMWAPEDSYTGNQYDEESEQDFRDLLPFQQVIADCEDDLVAEELKQENLIQRYKIPDRLVASFQPDTLALISRKFRTFDVFDRGTVPRQEVFALLSSLGRCSDLPDPYAIVARLSTFDAPPQRVNGDGDPGYEELSLTQLLQVIEVTREAKRHSATAQLSAIKIRMDRAATAARESIESASSFLQLSMEANSEVADVPTMRKVSGQTKRGSSKTIGNYGDRGRRPSVMSLKSRKSIVPQGNAPTNSSTNSSSNKVHKGESKTQVAAVPGRKKTLHQRSPSTVSIRLDPSITDVEGEYDPMQSHRSTIERESNNNNDRAEDDDRPTITVEVYEPANARNMKTICIFLLLGGEHDGAICCTMSLIFATRELTETEGIYYSTAPNETTRTTSIRPKQNSLMNALRMLKKRVLAKLDEGYKQRPMNQLNLVDDLLRTLQVREPHFRSPVTRSIRDRPITVPCSSLLTLSPMRNQCRFIASAPSSEHIRRLRPKPSKFQPQSTLPSDYRNLLTNWGLSPSENNTWIHNVNAASPLKPFYSHNQESARNGHLSPLHFPSSHSNYP